MSVFPGATPPIGTAVASDTTAIAGHTAIHNNDRNEIRALASKMGTGASTPISGLFLRGTDVGTSAWAQVILTSDVSGVLPIANGGTGQNSLTSLPLVSPLITGGGSWSGSPTLIAPVIADLTNVGHTHASASQGGQLNGANALSAGSVNFANLLVTIFTDQVQTQVNAGTAGGTMWWVNLGGIKILWGLGASVSVGTGGDGYTFTLPTFFTSIQTVMATAINVSVDGRQYCTVDTTTTSSIRIIGTAGANGSTQKQGIFTIGT